MLTKIRVAIQTRGFKQIPQLSATQAFPIDRLFNLTDIAPNRHSMLGRRPLDNIVYHKKHQNYSQKADVQNKEKSFNDYEEGPTSNILIGGLSLSKLLL